MVEHLISHYVQMNRMNIIGQIDLHSRPGHLAFETGTQSDGLANRAPEDINIARHDREIEGDSDQNNS